MSLPEPVLDDLRFQRDLVDEARRRIIRYCPEWTDYNLSDPGITLIELFAWMTELLTYRLNRVPEKNYIKFLEILGVHLQPPSSARTELTFWLSTPFPVRPEDTTVAIVPEGTEVTTQRLDEENEVTFTTDRRLIIAPPTATQLRREGEINKNYLPRLNVETFKAFQETPEQGDTFYIGLDDSQSVEGQILQLFFECEETQATGIRREDPPLVWEVSLGNGEWGEVRPSKRQGEEDTTGGLNNPQGRLTLYLPLTMQPDEVQGRRGYWLRCRYEQRRPEQGRYAKSPRIRSIEVFTIGATVFATHAIVQEDEKLGVSDGDAGQTFNLEHAPVLMPEREETVLVEELRGGELVFVPWERVEDFSRSTRYDRHFTLDLATGEVAFGPSVRQADGSVRQYGRVPESGREIRFSRYRYGGGAAGNVPTGSLQVLRSAFPYIDRVSNLQRADGGRDQESLEEAKLRARREIRAQQRAVTAEDFENLAQRASRAVARVKCRAPGQGRGNLPPGMVELLLVPAVFEALRANDLSKLALDPLLREQVLAHLDAYRLLTTTLNVREPRYIGVAITAEIVPMEYSHPETVRVRVAERLQAYLSPLPLDNEELFSEMVGHPWQGWPFGRDLYVSELFSLIQQVPGVKHVLDVHLAHRPVVPVEEGEERELTPEEAEARAPQPLAGRRLPVPEDTLLCSLEHTIELVKL